MASIGGDTNTLVRKFMSRRRRKPTPADRTAGFPKRGQGEATTFSRSSSGGGPRNWVKYPDGTIGPNDARARDRYGTNLPPAFPLTAARARKAREKRGAAGYNKGRLPG